MGTDFSQLNDQASEMTRRSLKRKCEVCKAAPNSFCTDTITGRPLEERWGRWCHIARLLLEAGA